MKIKWVLSQECKLGLALDGSINIICHNLVVTDYIIISTDKALVKSNIHS